MLHKMTAVEDVYKSFNSSKGVSSTVEKYSNISLAFRVLLRPSKSKEVAYVLKY